MVRAVNGPLKNKVSEHSIMSRPRIDTLLSEAMEKSVALIHGGEGCGKSCAVGSYLMGVDANVWWVQLSEADNHPSRLWETICSAIAQVNRENASALATMGFPGVGERYKMCYDIVLDMLKPNESYVLVFDDVHLISDPDVIAFLLNLVHSPLPDVSHIFISREETISVYDVGTSDEDVMIIDERDLLFTKVEVGDYLAMIEVNAVPSLVDEVYNASEGLAYLINFAGRLVKKRPDSAKRIRDVINRNMSKSIDDRFFEDLPDEMKKFYAKLSLLDHLSHAMIESLPVGAGLISEAMKRTSMIRYDAYTSSYHIHHMFLEYLWGKPDLLTEEERVETYRAAAQWCSGNGYRLEAIGYYEKIGDYNAVVDVARSMNPHIDFRAGAYLLGIFERAGPDVFDKNPHARVLYTRILLALGRIDEGIEKCGQFIADLEARKLAGENAVVLIWLYCNLGFAKIFKATDSGEYGFSEHFKKADEYMKEAGIEDSIGTVNAQIMPYSCLVGNNRKGDPEKLVAELSRSIPYSSRILGGCMYGSDDLTMSEIAYYRGDMTACERYAIQCCMKAREAGQSYAEGRALFLLLRMNLCRGRYSKIGEVLEQYDELVKRADSYVEYLQQEIVFSWYYASIGEIDNVVPWIKSDFVSPDSEAYFMGLEDIAKMKYYFVEKKYHVSLAFLDSRPRSYGVRKYMIGQIGMAVSEAICLYNHKDRDGAIDALRRGYELSAPNAFDMPFIEMGNNMRSLAGAALRGEDCGIPTEWLDTIRSKSATYAKRVAHVKSKYRQDVGKNSDVPLTLKEKEILRDMSQGLSRTEIATYRGVSVNTVKAMLQVVYEKLGADNSMDALRIAISKEIV